MACRRWLLPLVLGFGLNTGSPTTLVGFSHAMVAMLPGVAALGLGGGLLTGCGRDAREWAAEGARAFKESNSEAAEAAFQKALQADPALPEALYGLGWLYHSRRDSAAARVYFERCIEVAPGYYGGYKGLGSLHLSMGFFDEAEAALLKAQQLKPDEPSTLGSLGALYLVTRRLDLAEKSFQQALKLAPDRGELYYLLAELRSKQGQLEEALTLSRKGRTLPMEELKFRAMSATLEGQLLLQKAVSGLPEPGLPVSDAEVKSRIPLLDSADKALAEALKDALPEEKARIFQLERKVRLLRQRLVPDQ